MKTVAIISEYNPFHNGHLYQISRIREEFGQDTAIIAIMSGNYTQRGEIAVMDKWERAEAAVLCGANLVLELPFPYSMSSAEFFAKAGVHIANCLEIVDYLSFGSELGDVDALSSFAKITASKEFKDAFEELAKDKSSDALGYPKLIQAACEKACGQALGSDIFKSNNILALEYIKALNESNSNILPHTVKRHGADYRSESIIPEKSHQSATAIRELINQNQSTDSFVPTESLTVLKKELEKRTAPTDASRLDEAILSKFRLSHPSAECNIHDADGGLYNRLVKMSFEASTISSLIDLSATKKYTTARIRRAIWYSFFGVTSSDVKNPPAFTQVLALDNVGQVLLKGIKKSDGITVLTKPSSQLSDSIAKRQKELSDSADFIFQLSKPCSTPASSVYRRTPFVKK